MLNHFNENLLKSYRDNATRVSRLLRDELVPAKQVAAYWIEHVLRHGGTKHLQSRAREMPFYQIYLLDVALILSCIISILFFGLYKMIARLFAGLGKSRKVKTQ